MDQVFTLDGWQVCSYAMLLSLSPPLVAILLTTFETRTNILSTIKVKLLFCIEAVLGLQIMLNIEHNKPIQPHGPIS